MLRVRIEVRRRLSDSEALRDRRHDVNRHGLGKRQVRLILEHLHVEPGIGQRLVHVFCDDGGAAGPRHVGLTRHGRMERCETIGGDRAAEPLLQGSLPLESRGRIAEANRCRPPCLGPLG
jgi:hypothetical protein